MCILWEFPPEFLVCQIFKLFAIIRNISLYLCICISIIPNEHECFLCLECLNSFACELHIYVFWVPVSLIQAVFQWKPLTIHEKIILSLLFSSEILLELNHPCLGRSISELLGQSNLLIYLYVNSILSTTVVYIKS